MNLREKKKGKQFKTICLLGQKSRMRKKCRYGPLVFVIGFVELLILIDLTEKFLREIDVIAKNNQWINEMEQSDQIWGQRRINFLNPDFIPG